jgi:hypothetical protein
MTLEMRAGCERCRAALSANPDLLHPARGPQSRRTRLPTAMRRIGVFTDSRIRALPDASRSSARKGAQ